MSEKETLTFAELTAAEQEIVRSAKGWNGSTYFDQKSGIKIELVDGDVASYNVLEKGDQEVADEPTDETVIPSDETGDPKSPEQTEVTSPEATLEKDPEAPAGELETETTDEDTEKVDTTAVDEEAESERVDGVDSGVESTEPEAEATETGDEDHETTPKAPVDGE